MQTWRGANGERVSSKVSDLERAFQAGAGPERLVELLESSTDSEGDLEALSSTGASEVRAWIAFAVPDLISRGAVKRAVGLRVLQAMARRDPDSDTRDTALQTLVGLDADAARDLVPELVRRLDADDYYAPITAMWALAALDATGARAAVAEYAERLGQDRWQGRQARIVVDVLTHDDEAIATQLMRHDHDMTHALCRAALLRRGQGLIPALEHCSKTFDSECRDHCTETLCELRGMSK